MNILVSKKTNRIQILFRLNLQVLKYLLNLNFKFDFAILVSAVLRFCANIEQRTQTFAIKKKIDVYKFC